MRISFKCVLNSHVFGIRSSEIACDFRIANEVEMGHIYHGLCGSFAGLALFAKTLKDRKRPNGNQLLVCSAIPGVHSMPILSWS